jgi:Zn-dependent protease with chaperone function
MDFFAREAKIRRSSRNLVWLFGLAVLAIVVAVDLVCAFFLVGFRPGPLIVITAAVVAVIGLCSAYRVASLSGGGAAVARELDATEVPANATDPKWRRLRNVIEEVAIASGVPVPEIYVMQNEPGINAFAAGYTPTDAAVCVTQGCLDKLNRDELQGVVAHEFSHVLNGDMRLNIRLMGLLFGIMAIWVVGRFLMWGGFWGAGDNDGGGRRRGGSGQVALAGVALLAVGAIGVFFGRLIQAAVSRERESLADASAVQFTRQTSGIAGALKKIAVFEEGSVLQTPRRDEVRHMLFGDAELSSMFATHPPIIERIKALEPGFDPAELDAYVKQWLADGNDPNSIELRPELQPWEKAVRDLAAGGVPASMTNQAIPGGVMPLPGAPQGGTIGGVVPARGAELAITAAAVAAQVAAPGTDDYRAATDLHAQIPAALAAAARDPRGALATVFALAASEHPDLMAQQVQAVAQAFDAALADTTRSLVTQMAALHPMLRLPLAQIAFPALKRRPRPEVRQFVQTLDAIIHADGRVDLDEYCLAKLVQTQVVAALDPAASFQPGTVKLVAAQDELRDLVALVAHFGNDDEATARQAFQTAMHEALPNASMLYAVPDDWQAALDRALAALARLTPEGRQLTVQALARAIAVDGKVSVAESEMLRVVCAALGCPLPPLLSDRA